MAPQRPMTRFLIITACDVGDQREALWCLTLALIACDDPDEAATIARARLECAYDNEAGERVVWRLTRCEAREDGCAPPDDALAWREGGAYVELLSQHFAHMDEFINLFERPFA